MYLTGGITGQSLPEGTLCLTFDDGPGPQTLRLAEYLADQEVPAAFFVVGRHVEHLPDVPESLRRLGQMVGNHTHHHANLVALAGVGGDLRAEVSTTESLIGSDPGKPPTAFRPPYGAWSPYVARSLNADPVQAAHHVGPVLWDVDGRDWACWRDGVGPEEAAERYLGVIEAQGRGIVLLHDSTADSAVLRRQNRTFELVTRLLPLLRERGYSFVPLECVPSYAEAASTRTRLLIREVWKSRPGEGAESSLPPERLPGLELELRERRRAALRGQDGRLLVPVAGGRAVLPTDSGTRDGEELFDVIPVGVGRIALRSSGGSFLTGPVDAPALAVASNTLGPSEVFECAATEELTAAR